MRIGLNSPQALLALVVRRKWWIIAPFVALSSIVLVLTKSLPKSYVSSVLILVQPRDVPSNFVVDLVTGSMEERLKSIEQTVMSRKTMVSVIQEFEDQLPELKLLNQDGKVAKLQSQVSITWQGGDPNAAAGRKAITYFRIAYANQNPDLAQKIATRLTNLFIAQDGDARENQVNGTRDFFASEFDKVSQDLQTSEGLLKRMRSAKLNELPERLDTNLRRLDTIAMDVRTLEEALGRNATQRLTYEQLLAETAPVIFLVKPATSAPSGPAAVVAAASEDPKVFEYRKAKQAYEQMAALYPEKNPDVQTLKRLMENLAKKLSPEDIEAADKPPVVVTLPPLPEKAGLPPGTEPNPRYQSLTESLHNAETEYKILLKRKEDLAADKATYSRRIESTPQIELELADAVRENKDLQKKYDEIKSKLSAAELSVSLQNEQKDGQFKIVDPANRPAEAEKPKKALVALGGTAASLLLSLVFGVAVDIARQRVWTQSEIETFWGVPVLVDIPEILTDVDLAAGRKKKWVFAASALGVAMVFAVCLYGIHVKHEFILRQLDPVLQKVVYR